LYNHHEKLIYETLFLSLLSEMDTGQETGSKEHNALNASPFADFFSSNAGAQPFLGPSVKI